MTIKFSDITGGGIPYGNNAGRPANPGTGKLYSNGEAGRLELYTATGWENIVQEVPGVSSIGGSYLESQQSNTITIFGTNFVSGAIAYAIGTDSIQVAATSTTFNSLVQLSAVFTGLTAANEPYDIKVQNPSNLFGLLPDALFVNNILTWQTPAGSLGTFQDNINMSVSATAVDDSAITYSLASGSNLPSGLTLNSSTGLISGNIGDILENVTYTFTINASDGSNPVVPRTFSITFNAAPVWSTASGSLGTFNEGTNINITLAAPDVSDTVTYALSSSSSLPSGVTLNSSTGVVSGILPDIATDTTYNFIVNATDGVNTVARSFSITSRYTIAMEYLVVGGGGASGSQRRGGGGAGGMLTGTVTYAPSQAIVVTVGNGGAANNSVKVNGENSVLGSFIAYGGGSGALDAGGSALANGNDGGSGGGGLGDSAPYGVGGAGVVGQGNAGGSGQGSLGPYYGAGGGGGAAATGGNGSSTVPGNGGNGLQSSITGTATYYAGGGGGGYYMLNNSGFRSSGGLGGGGRGGSAGTPGESGVSGTGGGGGGGYNGGPGTVDGGSGGSGVVVLAYPNTFPALTNIPAGLNYDQPSRSGYRVYRFISGTGTITI